MNLATDETTATDTEPTPETEPVTPPEAVAPPEPLTEQSIEAWALDPENRERAQAFGKRLIFAKDADALRELPSLGAFEDRATEWAIEHQMKAKLMVMRLIGKLS